MQIPARRFAHSMVARLVLIGLLVVLSAAILRYVLLSTWLREDL